MIKGKYNWRKTNLKLKGIIYLLCSVISHDHCLSLCGCVEPGLIIVDLNVMSVIRFVMAWLHFMKQKWLESLGLKRFVKKILLKFMVQFSKKDKISKLNWHRIFRFWKCELTFGMRTSVILRWPRQPWHCAIEYNMVGTQ